MDEELRGGGGGGGAAEEEERPPPHFPVASLSRRCVMAALMCWGLTSMLMLRSVPAFVMQGTPSEGTFGMGDAGQIYDRPFTNQEKGAIVGAWGWGYTLTQMPGGGYAQKVK